MAIVSTPTQHTEPPLGVSSNRFPYPFNTLPDPPTMSNRMKLLKNRKPFVAGESLEYRHYCAHHDVPVDVNETTIVADYFTDRFPRTRSLTVSMPVFSILSEV